MSKPLIDPALVASAGTMARARSPGGAGLIRVAQADSNGNAEILVYGQIGQDWFGDGVSAENFANDIAALDAAHIDLRVNSGGGSVFEGLAIYNAIAQHKANVTVHIEGIAASIASIIAMAGDEIKIGEAANLMIHKPWSMAIGDAENMRKEADILDRIEGGLLDIYAARTGRPVAELQPLVAAETWFRGQEAVDAGFADAVTPAKKKQKALKQPLLNLFKNTPADLLSDDEEPLVRQFEQLLREGEGVSNAHAKRLAGLAARVFAPQRDAEGLAPRDEDDRVNQEREAAVLAAHLRALSL